MEETTSVWKTCSWSTRLPSSTQLTYLFDLFSRTNRTQLALSQQLHCHSLRWLQEQISLEQKNQLLSTPMPPDWKGQTTQSPKILRQNPKTWRRLYRPIKGLDLRHVWATKDGSLEEQRAVQYQVSRNHQARAHLQWLPWACGQPWIQQESTWQALLQVIINAFYHIKIILTNIRSSWLLTLWYASLPRPAESSLWQSSPLPPRLPIWSTVQFFLLPPFISPLFSDFFLPIFQSSKQDSPALENQN